MRYWQRGLLAGAVIFLVMLYIDVGTLVRSYSGACGDLLNKNAAHIKCSLLNFMLNDSFYGMYHGVNARLTWLTYLGIVFASVLLMSVYGLIFGKRPIPLPAEDFVIYK